MSDPEAVPDSPLPAAPAPERPDFPPDYGIPQTSEGLLPWSFAEERLKAARNYWVATVRPDGRPHTVPVWGVWLDGRIYIEGSPDTVRFRNITSNPAASIHLESGDEVVLLEGELSSRPNPPRSLTVRLSELYRQKYEQSGYSPGEDQWDNGGLYEFRPRKAFAWSRFPEDVTRFIFLG
jgi:hypothetical protein